LLLFRFRGLFSRLDDVAAFETDGLTGMIHVGRSAAVEAFRHQAPPARSNYVAIIAEIPQRFAQLPALRCMGKDTAEESSLGQIKLPAFTGLKQRIR
jgi:hypothetical protein